MRFFGAGWLVLEAAGRDTSAAKKRVLENDDSGLSRKGPGANEDAEKVCFDVERSLDG
jgi:hypothetical protein